MQSRGHTRRSVVLTGTSLALAACSGTTATHAPGHGSGRTGTPDPDPDQAIRRRAAQATAELIAAYDAALAAHPALAGRLTPLRAELSLHLAAFGGASGRTTPSPAATGSPAGTPGPGASASPAGGAATLADLAARERRTADGRTADLAAASPRLARLLASVAAAGAVHALLLTSG